MNENDEIDSVKNIVPSVQNSIQKAKIESLTPAQIESMAKRRDKWIKIGLATGPCDFEKCVHFAKIAYQKAGLTPPDTFLHATGPLHALEIIQKRIGGEKSQILSSQMYGNHDANWLAYYEFFWKDVGIEECHLIEGLVGLAENCGWWNGYTDFAVFQDRPVEIHRNENHALHRTDGPACWYNDGLQVWCINGHRVTEKIVMRPHEITVEEINSQTNGDIQAIMLERLGWERYIELSDATLLDHRHNEVENTKEALYDCKKLGLRLMVTCPTGRLFSKGIESGVGVKTCEQAQRWLGNDLDGNFNIIGRT